jgi:hypothetical protein
MQHQANSIASPSAETVHAPREPVCFCDELTVRQLDDRTVVAVSVRSSFGACELFQKL